MDNPLASNDDTISYLAEFTHDNQYLFFSSVSRAGGMPGCRIAPPLPPPWQQVFVSVVVQHRVRLGSSGTVCVGMSALGRLDLLQCARENDFPWDNRTCSTVAKWGYLDVLQWARSNGCPWGKDTCGSAAEGGHLGVLQ